MRKGTFDPSILLLFAIVLLLAGGIVFAVFFLKSDPMEEVLSGDRVINALFVLEDQGKPLGSYVLMYYPQTRRGAIFYVPGEVGLILPKINRTDRIDAVYEPGNIAAFEAEVEGLLEVDINFSFVITLEALGKIVDLIEGVDILIPSAVEIFDTVPPILFPSGRTRLDGDKARLYVSYNLPGEDTDMAHFRRQRFFQGFIRRMGERNAFLNQGEPARICRSLIRSSIGRQARTRFFDELAGMDTERLSVQSVGGSLRVIDGQDLLIPDYNGSLIKDFARQAMASLTQADLSSGERLFTVEVLNGTETAGLAGRTAELLRGFGYDVINISNAETSDYEFTTIIDRSGYEDDARAFAEIIRCTDIHYEAPASADADLEVTLQILEATSDFTLIIGRDFDGRYVKPR